MILQALTAYYEQLLAQGKVEAPGWDSRFKVSPIITAPYVFPVTFTGLARSW